MTPENLFWDQLLQLIEEGHVVPIVGRDLLLVSHQNREVLLYPFLAQRLAEYLDVFAGELPEGDEINTVVYRYMEKGHQVEDIYSALKMVMPADHDLAVPASLAKLAAIRPLKIFVTTTFDSLLVRAINQERFGGQPKASVYSYTPNTIEDLPGSADPVNRPVVYHLLGKLSAIPAYAVTQEDTLEFLHALQSESRQPHRLFDELNRSNLLLLGCSFGDWLARFFIRTAKRQRLLEARGSTDYLVDAKACADPGLVMFLRHYSTRTKIYEAHGALHFIDELHRRWMERHPTGEPEAKPRSGAHPAAGAAGTIFLSYASEDFQAVLKIRNALEAAGMDVFFDKADLRVGDDFEARLKNTISECALFMPVISKNTLTDQRRFFRIEWNRALEESLKVAPTAHFLVPVVIDETPATETAVPERFRKMHWERLPDGQVTPDFLATIQQLYRRYQKTGPDLYDL
jgi:hypothetical protein